MFKNEDNVLLEISCISTIPDWENDRFFEPYHFMKLRRFGGNMKATKTKQETTSEEKLITFQG